MKPYFPSNQLWKQLVTLFDVIEPFATLELPQYDSLSIQAWSGKPEVGKPF